MMTCAAYLWYWHVLALMSDERLDSSTCYMKRDEHGEFCGDPGSINVNQIHRTISGFASIPKHIAHQPTSDGAGAFPSFFPRPVRRDVWGFPKSWGYTNSWMVYNGKSMNILYYPILKWILWGYPHDLGNILARLVVWPWCLGFRR